MITFHILEILEPHILLTLRYNSGIGTVGFETFCWIYLVHKVKDF